MFSPVGADVIEVVVRENADIALVVSQAQRFAKRCGADTWMCAKIATACSELASNIVKYAHYGKVALSFEQEDDKNVVVIRATDRGPGIEDPGEAMRDSFSTSGTLGLGLPSVARIMDDFAIESSGPLGCCIVARKFI